MERRIRSDYQTLLGNVVLSEQVRLNLGKAAAPVTKLGADPYDSELNFDPCKVEEYERWDGMS